MDTYEDWSASSGSGMFHNMHSSCIKTPPLAPPYRVVASCDVSVHITHYIEEMKHSQE